MKKILSLVLIITLLAGAALWHVGTKLSAPANHPIGLAPPDLAATPVVFAGVHGWFVAAPASNQCVLLLHGIRADRTSMIARARFLKHDGYSSLLIDLQAQGETLGQAITFGYRESESAHAAVSFLKHSQHCAKVAVLGVSLGGAASLLGSEPVHADVFILESVYPTIDDAITDRIVMRLGPGGRFLTSLFTAQIPLRLHIPLSALRPVDAIRHIHAPVLVMAGSDDRHTPLPESQWLYDNAPNPKRLWIIQGAGHHDLYRFVGRQYEQAVVTFLRQSLGTN